MNLTVLRHTVIALPLVVLLSACGESQPPAPPAAQAPAPAAAPGPHDAALAAAPANISREAGVAGPHQHVLAWARTAGARWCPA